LKGEKVRKLRGAFEYRRDKEDGGSFLDRWGKDVPKLRGEGKFERGLGQTCVQGEN